MIGAFFLFALIFGGFYMAFSMGIGLPPFFARQNKRDPNFHRAFQKLWGKLFFFLWVPSLVVVILVVQIGKLWGMKLDFVWAIQLTVCSLYTGLRFRQLAQNYGKLTLTYDIRTMGVAALVALFVVFYLLSQEAL